MTVDPITTSELAWQQYKWVANTSPTKTTRNLKTWESLILCFLY